MGAEDGVAAHQPQSLPTIAREESPRVLKYRRWTFFRALACREMAYGGSRECLTLRRCRPRKRNMSHGDSLGPVGHSYFVVIILLAMVLSVLTIAVDSRHVYVNKWAVEIQGGDFAAQEIADYHGFINNGQIGSLENYYLFEHRRVVKRSLNPSRHHHSQLQRDPNVLWAEQQTVKIRVKRDFQTDSGWSPHLRDPDWPKMWYLHGGAHGGYDMRVLEAWERGYTGKGVVVTILDDGIEHTHTDLKENYDPEASDDINGGDRDPLPRYDSLDENRHGTRCAGEVAAVANNSKCAVGVAYRASIGGVRMLDGDVSDFVEAQALSLNPQHVDIYSASWGPDDNGKVVDGPAKLAREAFIQGVLKGRGGRGSIYVWASGNGGSPSDSCSCDGYTNSIFTLSVSSASERGKKPWYLEECSSTLVTTYSSGENYHERKIITTDLHNKCTEKHTGTSASAPLAAAMCALALEANPDLNWRDMQYISMLSARTEPLVDGAWVTNGVGRKVSHKYGYGLMDGGQMVQLAERWNTVPEQHICLSDVIEVHKAIEGKGISLTVDTTGCVGSNNAMRYLEHVQARISLDYSRRGDLQIHLTSPNGTRSTLLPRRRSDHMGGNFNEWPFMSVFFWGEDPAGTWTLQVENSGSMLNTGEFEKWQLILYGVESQPVQLRDKPRPRPPTPPPRPAKPPPQKVGQSAEKDNAATVDVDPQELDSLDQDYYPDHLDTFQKEDYGPLDMKDKDSMYIDYGGEGGGGDPDDGFLDREWEGSQDQGPPGGQGGNDNQEPLWVEPKEPVVLCHPACLPAEGCDGPGPQHCQACINVRLGTQGPCLESCPPDHYLAADVAMCFPCPSPCATCRGADPDADCLSCREGTLLDPSQGRCLTECPSGTFQDGDTCAPCHDECVRCDLAPSLCSVCKDGYELVEQRCLALCASNQYRASDKSCQPCAPVCLTCTGPRAYHCLLCTEDTIYHNGTCLSHCPPAFFETVAQEGRECRRCHPSCHTCAGHSPDQCTACSPPLKMVGSTCLEDCPQGQYEDGGGTCYPCSVTCQTCQGPSPQDCLACRIGMFLEFGHCVYRCQDGFYEFEAVLSNIPGQVLRECRTCDRTCRTCQGEYAENCTSCRDGLLYTGRTGQCTTACRSGDHAVGAECHRCNESCATCTGPTAANCTACAMPRYLMHGHCVEHCPVGHFPLAEPAECRACDVTCSRCSGSTSTSCLSCHGDQLLTPENACIEVIECERHQYYDARDNLCYSCDVSCGTCDGPSQYDCQSCTPPLAYHEPQRQCLSCCHAALSGSCCSCSPPSGLCIEYHLVPPRPHQPEIDESEEEKTEEEGKEGEEIHSVPSTPPHFSLVSPSTPSTSGFSWSHTGAPPTGPRTTTSGADVAVSRANAPWPGFVGMIVCLCFFGLALFFLIFGLLQARSNDKLCWKHRYQPVPTIYQNGAGRLQKVQYQNGSNQLHLTEHDLEDEDEPSSA